MILLIGLSNLLVIYVGGNQYINGEINLGVLAEFIIYVNMLTWPVTLVVCGLLGPSRRCRCYGWPCPCWKAWRDSSR